MPLIFEGGGRKLRAGIKRGTHHNRLAGHLPTDFFEGGDNQFKRAVGDARRIFHIAPRTFMDGLALRAILERLRGRIGDADVLGCLDFAIQPALVIQDFAAVSRPEHHGTTAGPAGQRFPLPEEVGANRPHRLGFQRAKRLEAHLQGDALKDHRLIGRRRRGGRWHIQARLNFTRAPAGQEQSQD